MNPFFCIWLAKRCQQKLTRNVCIPIKVFHEYFAVVRCKIFAKTKCKSLPLKPLVYCISTVVLKLFS